MARGKQSGNPEFWSIFNNGAATLAGSQSRKFNLTETTILENCNPWKEKPLPTLSFRRGCKQPSPKGEGQGGVLILHDGLDNPKPSIVMATKFMPASELTRKWIALQPLYSLTLHYYGILWPSIPAWWDNFLFQHRWQHYYWPDVGYRLIQLPTWPCCNKNLLHNGWWALVSGSKLPADYPAVWTRVFFPPLSMSGGVFWQSLDWSFCRLDNDPCSWFTNTRLLTAKPHPPLSCRRGQRVPSPKGEGQGGVFHFTFLTISIYPLKSIIPILPPPQYARR